MRADVDGAVALYRDRVMPGLRDEDGFEGAVVLATPEGKGLIVTFWETEEGAQDASGFAGAELERYMTMFRAPPGREHYEVVYADLPAVTVA
jgi:heme-degrading monooxygenase HmoA